MAAASPVTVLGAPWTVVAEQTQAEAIDAVQALSRTLILTGLFVLAGTALLGLLLARSIVAPLGALTRALKALADRQALTDVPGSARRDEIGDIARAVVTIRDMSLEEAAQQLQTTEAARLREEQSRRAMLKQLADGFEHSVGGIVEGLTGAVTELQGASGHDARRGLQHLRALDQRRRGCAADLRQRQHRGGRGRGTRRDRQEIAGRSSRPPPCRHRRRRGPPGRADMTDLAAARRASARGRHGLDHRRQTNLLALNANDRGRAAPARRAAASRWSPPRSRNSPQTTRATEEISRQVASIQTSRATRPGRSRATPPRSRR